jgi:anti-sigma regulatory factor (Ser/Thr protein kinase)
MAAETASLSAFTEFARKGALEAALPEACLGVLDLMIEEVFMNVCCHAYPDGAPGIVTLTYSIPSPGELSVEVGDQGVEFNPLNADPPDLESDLAKLKIGGLGIFLVKTLATSLAYRRDDGWNRLTFGLSAGSYW